MGVPVTFLSTNTKSDVGSAIALSPTERYLVVPWSDVKAAINSASDNPDTLEDWLAAIFYQILDKVTADTDANGAKITEGRRFSAYLAGNALDEGAFETGVNLKVYQGTLAFLIPDTNPARPPASSL